MTDGVGTTGASHNSLKFFPALLGRQIPQGQVSKHPTWEVVAGDGARWAQPTGSFLLFSSFWSLHLSLSTAASKLTAGDNSLQQQL